MSQTLLEISEVQAAARAEVEERGRGFVYQGSSDLACMYVPVTDPRAPDKDPETVAPGAMVTGCLVGQILTRTGRMTDRIAGSVESFPRLMDAGEIHATWEASRYLSKLQRLQDSGSSWGTALDEAEAWLEAQL